MWHEVNFNAKICEIIETEYKRTKKMVNDELFTSERARTHFFGFCCGMYRLSIEIYGDDEWVDDNEITAKIQEFIDNL